MDKSVLKRSLLWRSVQCPTKIISRVMFDLRVYGMENVPAKSGVLLAANHQSYLDPVLIAVQLSRPVSYMARSDLFTNRYFGWLIRNLHAFPIRRGESDVGALRETIRQLEDGRIVNVYPEGSRSRDGEIGPMAKGVALVVRKTTVPVVPVAIDGSFNAWGKGRTWPRPHPIRVLYGKPMDLRGCGGDEILFRIDSALRSQLAALREMRKSGCKSPRGC